MPVEVVDFYIKAVNTYGIVFGILALLFVLSIWILCVIVKNQNDKYLELQKSNIQQISNLYLRNEEPRKKLLFSVIEKSDNIRLNLYIETYSLVYDIRHNLSLFKENKELVNETLEKLEKLKENIFVNSVFLGELTLLLLDVQICLSDSIEYAVTGKLQSLYSEKHQIPILQSLNCISIAEKWIIKNMKTCQTQSDIDISEDIISKILERQSQSILKELY